MASNDRLSVLPDCIICHILSFLPTKMSVSTSILAKRWRFLWVHVPNLDLDRWTSSSEIISKVMSLHKVQNLDTFRLYYEDMDIEGKHTATETWISTAIERNVKNAEICLHYHINFPTCIFNSKTLVNLTLTCGVFIPTNAHLPCLKKLHFLDGFFRAGPTLPALLSGCPVLEELIIETVIDLDAVCCDIISPTIKRLAVEFQFLDDGLYCDVNHALQINAPSLRYLNVRDRVCNHIFAPQTLASLTEAEICLDYYLDIVEGSPYLAAVSNFVDSLNNVKYLKFSSHKKFSVELFADERESFTRFDNLIKLEMAADWLFLTKFLEGADNLEVLIIICEVEENLKQWMEPKRVPVSLISCLKTIRIDQLGCTEKEFDMVRYILSNAKVLKRMEICTHQKFDSNAKFDAQQRISSIERGSEGCELVFD